MRNRFLAAQPQTPFFGFYALKISKQRGTIPRAAGCHAAGGIFTNHVPGTLQVPGTYLAAKSARKRMGVTD